MVGSLLNTLIKNSGRVKIACLAQLVNVIAPIMTENGGKVWLQTIFYPFYYTSRYGRGTALDCGCECGCYHTERFGDVPYLDVSAVLSEDEKTVTVFAVNRSLDSESELMISGIDGYKLTKHTVLEGSDVKARNTPQNPENVIPTEKPISGAALLPKASWNMLVFNKA